MAEWGVKQTGPTTLIASTQEEAEGVTLEPGVVYEQRITVEGGVTGDIVLALQGAIVTLQQTFGMIDVTYWYAEGDIIIYQFMIPYGTAGLLPPLWAVIAIIVGALALIAIIAWVVFRVDVFGIGTLVKLMPGMMVTVVGGVVTSALPGATKLAGLIPLGFGMYMMLQALGMVPGPPPDTCLQHTTQTECEAAGCYWWSNGTCHATVEPPPTCGDYTDQTTCEANGCYWWGNACHSSPESAYSVEVSAITML